MENQIQQKNFMLIGELDSARTAPNLTNEWWRVPTNHILNTHIVNGEASALLQLLFGQIMVLPRNQYFDSKPWYGIVNHLTKSRIPTFAISLFGAGIPLTSNSVLEDIAIQFERDQKNDFALSAWPGISGADRRRIACNIRIHGNFKQMFKNVSITQDQKPEFEGQQEGLQHMFEYLKKNESASGLITRSQTNPMLWARLEADSNNPKCSQELENKFGNEFAKEYLRLLKAIPTESERNLFVGEQKKKLKEEYFEEFLFGWLDNRTNLYLVIGDYPTEYRKWLRLHIDWQYNRRLANSATGSDISSSADRADSTLPFLDRVDFADMLESSNRSLVDKEYIGIFQNISEGEKFLDQLTDLLINNQVLHKQLTKVRTIRETTDYGSAQWQETWEEHLEYINDVPNLILDTIGKRRGLEFMYKGTKGTLLMYTILEAGQALLQIGDPSLAPQVYQGLSGIRDYIEADENILSPTFRKIRDKFIDKPNEVLTGNVQSFISGKPLVAI